jgi:hypothetical protein
MFMPKTPVSVTLDESNLVWLRGLTARAGARSLSETLDRLVTAARESGVPAAAVARSVVGTIDIPAADAALDHADDAVRDLFARSLSRPLLVKQPRVSVSPTRRRGGHRRTRASRSSVA